MWQEIVHWISPNIQVANMLCTIIVFLFWHSKQYLYTTCCVLIFCREFNGQSLVTLWVNWCKNEGFWKRFTCNWYFLSKSGCYSVQVNLCQKLVFLNQLTHNMTRGCSLNPPKNTSSEHVVYKNCFCFVFVLTFKTIFVQNMFWTCIFWGIHWTISRHIVG